MKMHCSCDWGTFPGLDPLVASVFEGGHSMDDETWANIPSGQQEIRVNVSEWVLNSTSASYLLNDGDYDSHTPLLIEVHANHFSRSRTKKMNRNPDTLKEAADRRKHRQKLNKARGSADPPDAPTDPRSSQGEASSGAASSGSQRPPEPAQPPSGKGGKGGKSSKGKEFAKGKSKDKSRQEQGEELISSEFPGQCGFQCSFRAIPIGSSSLSVSSPSLRLGRV